MHATHTLRKRVRWIRCKRWKVSLTDSSLFQRFERRITSSVTEGHARILDEEWQLTVIISSQQSSVNAWLDADTSIRFDANAVLDGDLPFINHDYVFTRTTSCCLMDLLYCTKKWSVGMDYYHSWPCF